MRDFWEDVWESTKNFLIAAALFVLALSPLIIAITLGAVFNNPWFMFIAIPTLLTVPICVTIADRYFDI